MLTLGVKDSDKKAMLDKAVEQQTKTHLYLCQYKVPRSYHFASGELRYREDMSTYYLIDETPYHGFTAFQFAVERIDAIGYDDCKQLMVSLSLI